MGSLMPATPTQTLYVSVRRDELRQLKDERDQLRQQVAQLHMLLQQARADERDLRA
jgi:cell division protein FtsB